MLPLFWKEYNAMKLPFTCVCGETIGCHERNEEAVCRHRRQCGCTGFRPGGRSDRIRLATANWLWPHTWSIQVRLFVNEVCILLAAITAAVWVSFLFGLR